MLWMILQLSLTSGHADRSLQQHQNNSNVAGPNVFVELSFEDIFVEDCDSFLLSNANLEDEVISEAEYGDFLEFVCVDQGGCLDGFSYDAINDKLKSLFLNVACPESSEYNETSCLQEYQELGAQYGIVADRDSLVQISNRILWLCTSSFQIIRQEGLFAGPPSLNDNANNTHNQPYTQGTTTMGPTSPPTLEHTTLSPTQQITNATQSPDEVVPSDDGVPFHLGLGAQIMLICVGVVILFCLAVVVAGRTKHPSYDINQPHHVSDDMPKDIHVQWEHSATEEDG